MTVPWWRYALQPTRWRRLKSGWPGWSCWGKRLWLLPLQLSLRGRHAIGAHTHSESKRKANYCDDLLIAFFPHTLAVGWGSRCTLSIRQKQKGAVDILRLTWDHFWHCHTRDRGYKFVLPTSTVSPWKSWRLCFLWSTTRLRAPAFSRRNSWYWFSLCTRAPVFVKRTICLFSGKVDCTPSVFRRFVFRSNRKLELRRTALISSSSTNCITT